MGKLVQLGIFAVTRSQQTGALRAASQRGVAATIGTTIECHDFLRYSAVTGLVFAKRFFPRANALTGTPDAFAIYAVCFAARPIDAAIFGHWGDRLGRKSEYTHSAMIERCPVPSPTLSRAGRGIFILVTALPLREGKGDGDYGLVSLHSDYDRLNVGRCLKVLLVSHVSHKPSCKMGGQTVYRRRCISGK
jgi:hypothetical protein